MWELSSKRLPLVGRDRELTYISQVISGAGQPVLLIIGDAGSGKTFLLEEAERIAKEKNVLCPQIIDFYDASMHSHQGLEKAIAEYLDPDKKMFKEYWEQREKDPQAELRGPFSRGYQAAIGDRHAVLRFDTAERLEYERDSEEVRADCEVKEKDAPSWEWLLERIGDLPRTTVLIAARPTTAGFLEQQLLDAHGDRVLRLEIAGFTLEETNAYFRATDFGQREADKSPEMVEKVYLLAGGRPILIALALDWLERGLWDEQLYPVGVAELRVWKNQAQAEEKGNRDSKQWHEIRERFQAVLVEQIRRLASPLDVAVRYVALCRKGCNAAILSRLMGIGEDQAGSLIEDLLTLSFVKPPRPGSRDLLFLHDEMYDLVERYVWLERPSYGKQAELDQVIVNWYDEQIEELTGLIKASSTYQDRARLRRQQQLLMAERLYYQLDADPREGYREYMHLDEEAIAARETEWDVLLRNEALWFTSRRGWRIADLGPTRRRNGQIVRAPWVDHDCRRRWVGRYIARQDWDKAIHVAGKLLGKPPLPEEPVLYRPGLWIALATAQAYVGRDLVEPAIENAATGIEEIRKALEKNPEGHPEHPNPWLVNHLLGMAYLAMGMALRSQFQWSEAASKYQRAANCFAKKKAEFGIAEANNNCAYVLARSGQLKEAWRAHSIALDIREREGDEYPLGLSYNTAGLIHEREGEYKQAHDRSHESLDLFEEAGSRRGMALAQINLGRSLRRQGRTISKRDRSRCESIEKIFQDAEDHLLSACKYFDSQDSQGQDSQERRKGSAESFYAVEARNELGCLHRDWVASLYDCDQRVVEELVPHLERAETELKRAQSLIGTKTIEGKKRPWREFHYVDVTEDLARVYLWWGIVEQDYQHEKWENALDCLEEVRVLTGLFPDHDEYNFLMGKIHSQYARLLEAQSKHRLTAKHYALATGYLEKYSPHLPELRKSVECAYGWFRNLTEEEKGKYLKEIEDTWAQEYLVSQELKNRLTALLPNRPRAQVATWGKRERIDG